MFLVFHMRRLDVFPTLALGIQRAMAAHFGLAGNGKRSLPSPDAMLAASDIWRPYRSVATWYLWRASDV